MKTLVLAHYYTTPEVQQMADFVGDSLELSIRAQESNAERIVFAGVRFMAETAKLLNPRAEVILPNPKSTCSLVTQVEDIPPFDQNNVPALYRHITSLKSAYIVSEDTVIITYINSSAELKALSDIIVTSANVEEIVSDQISRGNYVFFTPDRNMGEYLASQNPEWGDKFDYWKGAVCEVHDKFKAEELDNLPWTNYGSYILAHPESPLPVLERADFVGSTKKMLKWVEEYPNEYGRIVVATEEGLLHNMRELRPKLDIQLAPIYSGCQCNACPFMKMNTKDLIILAKDGLAGEIISLDESIVDRARKPIDRMLSYEYK